MYLWINKLISDHPDREIVGISEFGSRAFKKYNYEMRMKFPIILYAIEFKYNLQNSNFANC